MALISELERAMKADPRYAATEDFLWAVAGIGEIVEDKFPTQVREVMMSTFQVLDERYLSDGARWKVRPPRIPELGQNALVADRNAIIEQAIQQGGRITFGDLDNMISAWELRLGRPYTAGIEVSLNLGIRPGTNEVVPYQIQVSEAWGLAQEVRSFSLAVPSDEDGLLRTAGRITPEFVNKKLTAFKFVY